MQIVIDIPDGDVPNKQEIVDINLHFVGGEVCECTYPYIVLPKGHGRLIDADKLEVELECGIRAGNYEEGYEKYAHINDMDDCIEAVVYADIIIEADGGDAE